MSRSATLTPSSGLAAAIQLMEFGAPLEMLVVPSIGSIAMSNWGVPGSQVLLLFQHGSTNEPAPVPGGVIPTHHGTGELHLCFAIPFGELATWEDHLRQLDIPVESRIRWPRGGTSLYFRDPDGSLLEFISYRR